MFEKGKSGVLVRGCALERGKRSAETCGVDIPEEGGDGCGGEGGVALLLRWVVTITQCGNHMAACLLSLACALERSEGRARTLCRVQEQIQACRCGDSGPGIALLLR